VYVCVCVCLYDVRFQLILGRCVVALGLFLGKPVCTCVCLCVCVCACVCVCVCVCTKYMCTDAFRKPLCFDTFCFLPCGETDGTKEYKSHFAMRNSVGLGVKKPFWGHYRA